MRARHEVLSRYGPLLRSKRRRRLRGQRVCGAEWSTAATDLLRAGARALSDEQRLCPHGLRKLLSARRRMQPTLGLPVGIFLLFQHAPMYQPAHPGLRWWAAQVRFRRKLPRQHDVLHTAPDLLRPELHRLLSEPVRASDGALLADDALLQRRDVLLGSPGAVG